MAMLMQALSGSCDAQCRFDANHCRDAGRLKLPACVAEEGFHGGKVEPAGDLVRARDSEALTSGSVCAAGFEFVLQRFALGFMGLECQVGMADRIGESFVGEIVEFGCGIGVNSLSHNGCSGWLGLEPRQACPRLPGSHTLGYHKAMVKKNRPKIRRPATGKGLGVLVRFPDKELAALDKWVARDGGLLSRPQAIRRLVILALEKSEDRVSEGTAEIQKASQLADHAAEQLVDKSMPPEEQQRRKRALIKGPKEFRDIREDVPRPRPKPDA